MAPAGAESGGGGSHGGPGFHDEYTTLLASIRNQSERLLRQFGEYTPTRLSIEEIQDSAAAAEALTRRLARFGTRQATEQPEILSPERYAAAVFETDRIGRFLPTH